MKDRILKMLQTGAEAKRQKAITSLQLLMENPAGIGDHSTQDFYNNIEEAFQSLVDADDMIQTLEKYDWDKLNEL